MIEGVITYPYPEFSSPLKKIGNTFQKKITFLPINTYFCTFLHIKKTLKITFLTQFYEFFNDGYTFFEEKITRNPNFDVSASNFKYLIVKIKVFVKNTSIFKVKILKTNFYNEFSSDISKVKF